MINFVCISGKNSLWRKRETLHKKQEARKLAKEGVAHKDVKIDERTNRERTGRQTVDRRSGVIMQQTDRQQRLSSLINYCQQDFQASMNLSRT